MMSVFSAYTKDINELNSSLVTEDVAAHSCGDLYAGISTAEPAVYV